MASGTVCVIPRNEPANISVAPNSPSARPHASASPAAMPEPAPGLATRRNVRASEAPGVRGGEAGAAAGDRDPQERPRLGGPERARGVEPGRLQRLERGLGLTEVE